MTSTALEHYLGLLTRIADLVLRYHLLWLLFVATFLVVTHFTYAFLFVYIAGKSDGMLVHIDFRRITTRIANSCTGAVDVDHNAFIPLLIFIKHFDCCTYRWAFI